MKFRAHFQMAGAGFTLIELIIVIMVLGILSTVLLPRILDITKDAKNSAITNTAQSVRQLISDWQKEQYVKKMTNADWVITGMYPDQGGGAGTSACYTNPPDMTNCFPNGVAVRMLVTGSTNQTQSYKDFPVNAYQNTNYVGVTTGVPCATAGAMNGWYYNATSGLFWANNFSIDGMTDTWCVDKGNPTSGMGTGTP